VVPQVLLKAHLERDPRRVRVLEIAPQHVAAAALVCDQPVVVAEAGFERTDHREPPERIRREDRGFDCINHGSGPVQPAEGFNTFQDLLIRS
jgi:hypothetical protein